MRWSWTCFWLLALVLILVLVVSLVVKYQRTKKKLRKKVDVSQLHKTAKTGDLLLFSTCKREKLPPGLRKAAFGSEWTHSGILYFDPITKRPLVWEMNRTNGSGLKDLLTSKKDKDGAQLVDLEDKLLEYEGYCLIRQLDFQGEWKSEKKRVGLFKKLFDRYGDRKFNFSPLWVGLVVVSEWFGLRPSEKWINTSLPKFDSLLCSELTTLSYQELGAWSDPLYPPQRPLTLLLPHHFSEGMRVGNLRVLDEFEVVLSSG